eukprot:GHVP01043515.1.p1 GENE.GHVP01043515.1~~GHVP01043515.1.p1  ORF type:complete len:281 (+),score=32.11 GHVP01043515.1:23-844(+)
MEGKILSDLLSAACEDVGLSQIDGFHPESLGTDFRGIRFWSGHRFGSTESYRYDFSSPQGLQFISRTPNPHFPHSLIKPDLRNYLSTTEKIERIMGFNFCLRYSIIELQGRFIGEDAHYAKLLVNEDPETETEVCIGKPFNEGGRRYWTVRICNCDKREHFRDMYAEEWRKHPCFGVNCRGLEITWNDQLVGKEKKKIARDLWYHMEHCFVSGMGEAIPSPSFEEVWKDIKKSEHPSLKKKKPSHEESGEDEESGEVSNIPCQASLLENVERR